jgi:hypothetical protein
VKAAAMKATMKSTTAEPATRRSACRGERDGCSSNERDESFSEHENLL